MAKRKPQDITAAQDPDALLTLQTVMALTGLRSTSLRDQIKAGLFPQPRRFGPRNSRWVAREVRAWLQARELATRPEPVAQPAPAPA